MAHKLPSRKELIHVLDGLLSGNLDRSAAAAWASAIINDDETAVDDRKVWDALAWVGSVDLPGLDREFLYAQQDFTAWKATLKDE